MPRKAYQNQGRQNKKKRNKNKTKQKKKDLKTNAKSNGSVIYYKSQFDILHSPRKEQKDILVLGTKPKVEGL